MSAAPPENHDVIVLGGGLCGLSAAWKLAEVGYKVVLLEQSDMPGGVVKSVRDGDWLYEYGPNTLSFYENDQIHRYLRELDLEEHLMARSLRDSDRFIWRAGALRKVPTSPLHLLRKNAFSRRAIARALTNFWIHQKLPNADISVGAFFSAVLGRKAVNQVLGPVLAGIYASDPFSLSLEAAMPQVYEAAKSSGPIMGTFRSLVNYGRDQTSGRRLLASFMGGMQMLTDQLATKARQFGAQMEMSAVVSAVETEAEQGIYVVTCDDGRQFRGRKIICALPATAAAAVLKNIAPDAEEPLARIRYVPMITACVGVREEEIGEQQKGYGYLAVRSARSRSLGMVWSDRIFEGRAPKGCRLFTVFLGGQVDRSVCSYTDEDVAEVIRKDLRAVMKWKGSEFETVHIRRLPSAIPLLEVGHVERIRTAVDALPENVFLTGNYVAGVSVPACMKAGTELARRQISRQRAQE